jgi:GNAT superfamily N-acetyltransferase
MAPASFALRLATPEDAPTIIDAHRDAVRGTPVGYYSREIIEEWGPIALSPERVQGFARAIASGQEVVVVAVEPSGSILGFGSIVPMNDELRAVYVRSKYGRKGIGRAILQRLEELARKAGLKELSMDASINAESFYNANGFVSDGFGEHTMSSGARMACVRMRKRL